MLVSFIKGEESKTAVFVLQCAAAADSIARRTRNGGGGSCRPHASEQKRKGHKHITMQFLEEGGYFDAPIQVSLCLAMPLFAWRHHSELS